ncbi:MAG TPA: biopolymer transporter ExbD [Novosphingobium sp.]|nr:biopolymer transporter ExbD [Novosphingobium sp.]
MSMSGGSDDGEPMMEMNTTPLIDVMLVLLIMFIITIPVATHATNIDLPAPQPAPLIPPPLTEKNKVVIMPNSDILWNGASVTPGQLVTLLQQTLTYPTEPELQYQPDPQAPYQTAAQVLHIIKDSGVTKFGFVGNEQYSEFSKAAGA